MIRLLAHRDARLLLAGETLSMFGDRAMLLVMAIWAKSLTGSDAAAGLTFFAFTLPTLAGPLAGMLVDRVRRRTLMIATDCLIGAALLSLLLVRDSHQLWLIYVVAVLYGAANAIFSSAQSALLTVVLPTDLLADVNGVLQTIKQGLRLVAPLVGAGLFVVAGGGGPVVVLDSATFAVSAVCLAGLRARETVRTRTRQPLVPEITAGIRHVWRVIDLRRIVLASAVAVLVFGFDETLFFSVIDRGLHQPPSFMGVLGTIQGIGAIAGGVTAARVLRRVGDARLVGAGVLLFGLGNGLLVIPSLGATVAGVTLAGAGLSWAVVGLGTAVQVRTPRALQGRVYSSVDVLVGAPQTASIALGAALSTRADYRLLLSTVAAVMVCCGTYLLRTRSFPRPAVTVPQPDAEPGPRQP